MTKTIQQNAALKVTAKIHTNCQNVNVHVNQNFYRGS